MADECKSNLTHRQEWLRQGKTRTETCPGATSFTTNPTLIWDRTRASATNDRHNGHPALEMNAQTRVGSRFRRFIRLP